MTQHSHHTAPSQFVEAAGVRLAYRRFGRSGGVPLVFNMHFIGTMDPDGLAATREGISSTSGEVPASVEEMAANAAAFIRALGLAKVDVLGISLGGLVAQALTVAEPRLVRRLILVGTGPQGGEGMATLTPEAQSLFGATSRLRQEGGRDPEVSEKVTPAQISAIGKWGAPRAGAFDYLREIAHPTLEINGSNDVISIRIPITGRSTSIPRYSSLT